MKRRKHRVVVEITLDEPVTAKEAAWVVAALIDLSTSDHVTRVTAFETKEYVRVFNAEMRKLQPV